MDEPAASERGDQTAHRSQPKRGEPDVELTAVGRGGEAPQRDGLRALHVAGLLRWGALTASVPYTLAWTRSAAADLRLAVVLAHAAWILAAGAWIDASATERGQPLRVRLTRQRGDDPEGLRTAALLAATVAAGGGAWRARTDLVLGVAVLVALGAGWLAARLPSARRWFLVPEVAAALGVLLVPALLVDWRLTAAPPLLDTAAGACLVAGIVLAVHLRDRAQDLAARVPTSATRDASRTRGWLLALALTGALLGAAPLTLPLSPGEVVRVVTLGVFGVASTIRRGRVVVLYAAHAVFAATMLFG